MIRTTQGLVFYLKHEVTVPDDAVEHEAWEAFLAEVFEDAVDADDEESVCGGSRRRLYSLADDSVEE